ncbi:MAG: flagellar export chaperone FlgN [Rubripirellula sp.]
MDGQQLSQLMTVRWTALQQLLEVSEHQIQAIRAGHMSELMRILSQKQPHLSRLSNAAAQLRATTSDDPEQRHWDSPALREACRIQQEECEKMHLELLAIEAHCETLLQETRTGIQSELQQIDNAHLAASSYAQSQATGSQPTSHRGGQLDLSSDS